MASQRPRSVYTEDEMADAILDVTENGLSQNHAAQKHGIPQQSISDRFHGQTALDDQVQPNRHLSRNQEANLASWILRQESLGYAPSHGQIRACVVALLKQQNKKQELGRNWVAKFIKRHPKLKTKPGRRQEANRFNSFTPKAVHWYFDIREEEYGWIKPENTVNVDEGGIMAGFGLDSLVVGSSDPKRKALLKGPQSRNWTSFIEAITADGRALTPGIIFKGKELQKQWFFLEEFRKIADWNYITSPNGWTDNHIAVEWLERVYLPQTQPADESDARLIILDGHGSHATDEWIVTCFLNNVYCCYLPAHCSHGLQPLDNGVFNASKAAYQKELEKLASLTDSAPVDKVNFIRAYAKAPPRGYAFVIKRSSKTANGRTHVIFNCDRGAGRIPSLSDRRQTTTRRTGCLFSVLAKESLCLGGESEEWKEFFNFWHEIVASTTEDIYNERLEKFKKRYIPDYINEVGYILETWLDLYKKSFVKAWVNTHLHFEQYATSRVEGIHSLIKLHLNHSQVDLFEAWRVIKLVLMNQLSQLEANQARQHISNPIRESRVLYSNIRGWISHEALRKVETQRERLLKEVPVCTGVFTRTLGLPCAHSLQPLLKQNQPLLLNHFHSHWHLRRPGSPRFLIEPRKQFDRLTASSTLPPTSTQREPSTFERIEKALQPKAPPKCSRCHQQGHMMTSKACPLRYKHLLQAPTQTSTIQAPTQDSTTTHIITHTTTRSITRSLSPSSSAGSSIVSEIVAYTTTHTTTHTTTRVLSPPAARPGTVPAANAIAVPALRADDPRAIFQRYKEAREAWFTTLPRGAYKTNQQYRRAMGLPLRYSKAEYDWCLDYRQMGSHCKVGNGTRDWTKEEMMSYLDWDRAENDRVEQSVEIEMAEQPFSRRRAERCAPKRTDGDAGLPPPNERSGTQPTSPEKLRQRHAARRLFRESLSQPHVVLGTPIPPTQQSTRRFRALAPSPPVQPTAHPIASHSDPSTVRSSTTGLGYSYLAARFHKGGKDSQDEPSKAVARAKQAAIQRDHRSRRRVGETVSLTPTISQLGVFGDFEGPGEDASQDRLQPSELLGGDEIRKEGDDRGQFSESDIDAEDYFNLLLSPARPRRYLKQLGVESDPDLGDEHENSDNDCVDGSPLRHRLRQPSARPRRGRRGPAPGTGGRPRKSPRQARSSMPPRRIRSPVIIPPEELAVFHAQDPVWNGDLDACALTDRDKATLREFWTTLDNDQMEYCTRCQECWFQMKIDSDGICERCYRKDRKRRPDEPYFFSADNQLDFGPVPARLPQLTPTEESLLARVHVHVNIMLVRGQQYKYRGHVVHFLREVGLVYNQLPLLPQELNTVLLRPANTSSHANLSRQFTRQFRVRRQPVVIWLDYLRRHHPGYRCVVIDEERLNQLPQDGNVLDAIPQSQVETADVGPDSPEEDQEAEPDLEDEAAVPDLLAKDTELDALRSILSGESGADSELSTSFQAQAQHELQLPNIRHTPINEFNRSHALLSLAFPCLFPDGRADFVEPRLRSIDYRDYVEHAMRWHDGRFARHPTFRFVAFNTLMRSQARSRSRFFVKQQDGRQQPLTREQLIQALEHSEDPEAQALINSITRHAVSIRGTRPFWNKRRQDLEAYAYNLGCPGAFITFSPADLHWRSLYQHMPQYDDWLAATEPERMALSRRLLRQNPHIAAFHFYRRYCLFRDIVLSKKFNITDYWDRYEWQGRGSPHNHGLYWMDSCPGTDMDDEAARDVFARTWGFHVTAINPEPSRAMPQGEGNPLSVDPLSIEMTFLRLSQIVNRCQRHKCNTTYCLRVRKRTGDLARDMEGAAADIEAANVANPERECRFDFPRALRELAAVIRKEGRSYYVFEAARNDSLMNHFNPAIILGWLANIDISPCTSLQAVITYAAKYCSKSEKKTEPYCKLADQVLPHTAHLQPLLSFSSRLMNKLIAERDYSAQEISHLLLNIPLQEGTRMVVVVDCRPLELHGRSYRVDEDVIETVGSYRKYLERNDQHEDVTYLEYLQSYNLKTWRRLAANAKKRVLSYFPRYKSIEASPQFNDFCRVKLMMAHPHRSPRELLVMDGQRFDSFAAVYKFCRQLHHTHADDHYGDPDAKELRAEDDEFEPEAHEEPVTEEDWHELARMLPDRPLEEEDIDILGRRDIDINYDWTSHIGRYTDDGILNGDYWKQRKAENLLDLDVDDQPLEARDSLNPEQRLVYDTVMDHFLTQNPSQLLLHVDGGGGTGKSYLINLLSAHLQAATGGRGTPVWRAAPTGVAGNQISGTTLHSLLHLPINKDFRPLSPIDKAQLQKKLKDIKYLIIDEKSMLGLRQLSWIDDRLREAFPSRNEEFFGGLNILLVGDFFQLPPVLQKPLYYDKEVQGVEIKGRNAYRRFDKTVFLKVVQRQRGDDQEAFRTALGELRLLQLSKESWKLLSSRVQAKLDDREVARFVNALRVYATKDRVNEYNHYHLDRLSRPAIQVTAKNVGSGAAAAPDDKAGNLAKQIPICLGARLMLTSNLWQPVGLCNGARGTVYDIGWAPGAEPIQDPPCVIMMEFDKYNGPVFLTTPDGKKIVPILPVERDFLIGATLCTRTQFPLIVCYAITVHKSQSITEDMIVTDLSCRDFQTGLSYVAVSRVKTLEGLMLDAPFDRNHLIYASPPDGMKMKMRDHQLRRRQVLTRNPYKTDHCSA
ncbi:hypothetical protein HZS61_008207 [Fusarium oxysporum f. sp. conglutinans]|uniref:ATP-dependent DNA helicase n=1 Tax=Fusarium oxysporum f. sp. conglutinans TaxID=100902 RepID=A0A8H6H2F9_FUSOX|nr:hypothetical protein HZS61_008207 [Fusarium oxysporum f. sp. conglutinans]